MSADRIRNNVIILVILYINGVSPRSIQNNWYRIIWYTLYMCREISPYSKTRLQHAGYIRKLYVLQKKKKMTNCSQRCSGWLKNHKWNDNAIGLFRVHNPMFLQNKLHAWNLIGIKFSYKANRMPLKLVYVNAAILARGFISAFLR